MEEFIVLNQKPNIVYAYPKFISKWGANYFSVNRINMIKKIKKSNIEYDLLSNRVEIQNIRRIPKEKSSELYIGLADVNTQTGELTENNTINEGITGISNVVRKGQILFSKLRPNLNKVTICPQSINEALASTEFCIFEARNIDKYYLFAVLKSNVGLFQVIDITTGSTLPRLDTEDILNILIPIPSPEIQKYIGDKVRKAEELREEAKRLKKEAEEILNRELNLNKLEESLKSSINSKHNWITSMDINDRIDSYYYKRRYILVNQHLNDYECIQIRDIASVDYGYMPTEDYADENNGVPLIRVTNMIGNLLLDLSDLKYISKSINIPDDKYVDDGDILVVQCGNTTGKIALMTKEVENYLYPSFCLRIKLRNKSINNKYLALLMEMSIIQEQIWQSASYSSVRPNTTKPAIENIRIPLIEKQKQEDVGALVEKYIDNIYQSKQLILEAKQEVEDLIEGNFDMSKVKANS